jgi:hypothetical protein
LGKGKYLSDIIQNNVNAIRNLKKCRLLFYITLNKYFKKPTGDDVVQTHVHLLCHFILVF